MFAYVHQRFGTDAVRRLLTVGSEEALLMSVSTDATTPDAGYMFDGTPFALSATSTVTSLSVLVDEQGTYYVDDVVVAGQTLGQPSD